MAKLKTKKLGSGKSAFTVNQCDYDDGFPMNEGLRKKVKAVESKKAKESK